MEQVKSKDGTIIAFDRTGKGPALIVVIGALADRSVVPPQAAVLAPEFTVIAYDRRGRGDSGDTPPYAVEREIEDLDALIRLAGGSALVLGHSSGAVLALLAAAAGLAIPRLAVYEPPFIVDNTRVPIAEDYGVRLRNLISKGDYGVAAMQFLAEAVEVPAEIIEQMHSSPMWPSLEKSAPTLRYDFQVMGDTMAGHPLPAKRWASVTQPTLVIDGGASPPWIRHAAQSLAAILPNAWYRTLEGQQHSAGPAVLAPLLIEFFKEGHGAEQEPEVAMQHAHRS
jgi:pimeloyl-ACP methyl ester carboxylesterase